MKIFVRSTDLGSAEPTIVGFYSDDSDVSETAHGLDAVMLTVPSHLIQYERLPDGSQAVPKLNQNWREQAGAKVIEHEARKRINEAFALEQQLLALHELQELIIQHGTDMSSWPTDARNRKAEFDQSWTYVREIKERMRATTTIPPNPSSDKNWPTRLAKK
jgi:hypothetical protein